MRKFSRLRLTVYFFCISFIQLIFTGSYLQEFFDTPDLLSPVGLMPLTAIYLYLALLTYSLILILFKKISKKEFWLYWGTALFLIFITITLFISSLNSAARFREQDAIRRHQKK